MMLWGRDRNWGHKCSLHVTGNNIETRIHEYSYLPRSHPSRTVPACSLFPTMLLLRIYESCVEPGHLATMFVKCICASQMICTLMEWNCFLLTYTNSSCDGAFIAMCVQSIAPITLGKPAPAANCTLMLACSAALYGNLIYVAEMRIIPSHLAGMAWLRVDWHSPNWLASVLPSNASRSSAHSSRRISLRNLKWLMSQSPLCASKSSLSLPGATANAVCDIIGSVAARL